MMLDSNKHVWTQTFETTKPRNPHQKTSWKYVLVWRDDYLIIMLMIWYDMICFFVNDDPNTHIFSGHHDKHYSVRILPLAFWLKPSIAVSSVSPRHDWLRQLQHKIKVKVRQFQLAACTHSVLGTFRVITLEDAVTKWRCARCSTGVAIREPVRKLKVSGNEKVGRII